MGIRKGDIVFLKAKPELGCARVELLYVTVEGHVRLDRELDGLIAWSARELVVVTRVARRVAAALAEFPGDPEKFPYESLSETARAIVNETIFAFREQLRQEHVARDLGNKRVDNLTQCP